MDKYIFYKDSSGFKPKNISKSAYDAADYGHAFTEYTPIPRHFVVKPYFTANSSNAEYKAVLHSLKNTINYYFGEHPRFNFDAMIDQPMALLNVPSQNLGNGLQKGSIDLRISYNGDLLGQATDHREDGVLYDINDNEVGFVLYKEGIIILLSDIDVFTIMDRPVRLVNHENTTEGTDTIKWYHFGVRTVSQTTGVPSGIVFEPLFSTIALTPTSFTFVYADKGEVNHSNNPTYLKEGSYKATITDKSFIENIDSLGSETRALEIKNTLKIPFIGAQAPLQKDTYITKIGLYDEDKQLIAVASLANPIRKTEKREFLFKLKLDL
jgi:hypothetical protein